MHRTTKLKLQDLNPHLMCALCGGYLVDATAIIECLHSFCRTCIIRYLETSKFCPICDVQVHKTKPHLNIRRDKTLQNLVYKLVPGLFQNEMKKRREFYAANPEAGPTSSLNASEERGEASQDRVIYTEDEKISLCLQHCHRLPPYKNGVLFTGQNSSEMFKECDRRFLLCPAGFTIGLIKKFVRLKFDLQPQYQIEVFHLDESLQSDYTLMDIAYIYAWRRHEPLKLYYIVYDGSLRHTINLPNPMQFTITAHKKSKRGRKRKHSPSEEKTGDEEEEEEMCREEETEEEDDAKMFMDEAIPHANGFHSCGSSSSASSTSSKAEEGSEKMLSSETPEDKPVSPPPAKSLKLAATACSAAADAKETVPEAVAVAESCPVAAATAASAAVAHSSQDNAAAVATATSSSGSSTSSSSSNTLSSSISSRLTNGHCANTGPAEATTDKAASYATPKSMNEKAPKVSPGSNTKESPKDGAAAPTLLQSLSKGTLAKPSMLTSKLCPNKTTLIITNRKPSTNGTADVSATEVPEAKVANGVTPAVSKQTTKTFSPISQISAHIEKTLTTMNANQKPSPNFHRLLEMQRMNKDKMVAIDKSRAMQISNQKLEFTKRAVELMAAANKSSLSPADLKHHNGRKLTNPGDGKLLLSNSIQARKEHLPVNKETFSALKDKLKSNGPLPHANGPVLPSANSKAMVNGQKGLSFNNDVIITVDKPKVISASLMEAKSPLVFSSALTTTCSTPAGPRSLPSFNSPLTTALLTPKSSSPEGQTSRAASESGSETSGSPAEARMGAPSPPKDDNASPMLPNPMLPNPTQNKPRKDLLSAAKDTKNNGHMSPYLRELKAMATQRREGAKVLKINGITTDLVLKSTKRAKPSNSTDCLTPQRPTVTTPGPKAQMQQPHQQQPHQQQSHQQQQQQPPSPVARFTPSPMQQQPNKPSVSAPSAAPAPQRPSPAHQNPERVSTPVNFYHPHHHPGGGRGPSPALSPHSPISPHSPSNGAAVHLRHISPPPVAQFFSMRPPLHRPLRHHPDPLSCPRPEANGYDAPLDFTTKKSPSASSPPSNNTPGQSSPAATATSPPNERTLLKVPNFTSLRT